MATTPATSGKPEKAAPSAQEGKSCEFIPSDVGLELETALPPSSLVETLRPLPAESPLMALEGALTAVPSASTPDEPVLDEKKEVALAQESAAEHLSGMSATEIDEVDDKFVRLLAE